jgi:hypothetical protein
MMSNRIIAQPPPPGWIYNSPGFPNGNVCNPPGFASWLGYTGIRTQAPAVPLHIYSGYCLATNTYDPAVLRLQTDAAAYHFGESSIQFWSGGQLTPQDWQVASIKPITNAVSIITPPIFNTANPASPAEWYGGLAFYCSGSGQRPVGDGAEVMRLYDQRVAINSTKALGRLDVVPAAGEHKPRFVFSTFDNEDWSPSLKFYTSSLGGEFGSTYPLWMTLEWDNPPDLGSSRFFLSNSPVAIAMGEEFSNSNFKHDRFTVTGNGNVGVNQRTPDAKFQVTNGSVLFDGSVGGVPKKWTQDPSTYVWSSSELGTGTRLMWIPEKAAFRAGEIISGLDFGAGLTNQWADYNIGRASVAMGQNCQAFATAGTAIGILSTVRGARWYTIPKSEINMDNEKESILTEDENSAHGSFALGHLCRVDSNIDCMASGYFARIDGPHSRRSFALGENVKIADAATSFVLGSGIGQDDITTSLVNNVPFSMMVGFQSTGPALFVSGGTIGSYNGSKVGIGLSTPANILDVRGKVVIGSGTPYAGTAVAPNDGLIIEGQTVMGGTAASTGYILTVNGPAISIGGGAAWTTSDRNLKKDIVNFTDGLAKLRQINTVRFHYNGTLGIDSTQEHIGVIAQDIKEISPYSVRLDTLITRKKISEAYYEPTGEYDSSGADRIEKLRYIPAETQEERSTFLAYNPSDLQYIAINAIKELDSTVSKLETRLNSMNTTSNSAQTTTYAKGSEPYSILEQRVKDLEEKIQQIQTTCCKNTDLYDDILLEQNVPNPFSKETIVTYFVPERLSGRIELVISDITGTTILQKVPVQTNIPSQYTYSTDLQTGVYLYGISLNGQIVKSKKMMIIK